MLNYFKRPICLVAACFAISLTTSVSHAEDPVPTREDLTFGSVSAIITAVDVEERSVTLKFEDDREESFSLGDEIEDMSHFSVGDTVLAGYARSLALELRPATAAEIENPLEITEQVETADPATGTGSAGRLIRAVTTVEVLDRINMTATLRGPLGNYLTIDVQDAEKMTTVHIGQTVVATFTEAVVLSLSQAE